MKTSTKKRFKEVYTSFRIVMFALLFIILLPLVWKTLEDMRLYYTVFILCFVFMLISGVGRFFIKKKNSLVGSYFYRMFLYSILSLGCFVLLFILVSFSSLLFAHLWLFPSVFVLTLMISKARFLVGII